jgi:hypothetical protein
MLYQLSYSRLQKRAPDALVDGGGFEPPKAKPLDLQSSPVDRFGTRPLSQFPGTTGATKTPFQSVKMPARQVELAEGLEPPTCSLQMSCSTN